MSATLLELHCECAAALKHAYELGCALASAMDAKAQRFRYGRPVFDADTGAFRDLLDDMLNRRKMFYTGGSRLRMLLDDAVTVQAAHSAQNTMSLYFGWKYSLKARMNPCTWMTMSDAIQLRVFADRLDAALVVVEKLADRLPGPAPRAFGIEYDSPRGRVTTVTRRYRGHIRLFRRAYEDMCARAVQSAWRRARDTPGYAVWRRRMLAEFHDMQTMLV